MVRRAEGLARERPSPPSDEALFFVAAPDKLGALAVISRYSRHVMTLFGRVFGTFFGVGYIPVVPATWTSLVVAALYYFVPLLHAAPGQALFFLATLLIGIPACGALERVHGRDPKQATMDEACGM